jgi:hypothetical protein
MQGTLLCGVTDTEEGLDAAAMAAGSASGSACASSSLMSRMASNQSAKKATAPKASRCEAAANGQPAWSRD